jgi:hypothetical protein
MTYETSYTTRAPFLVAHRWQWIRWTHADANKHAKHAAILAKANELNAAATDPSQADHYPTRNYPFATRG